MSYSKYKNIKYSNNDDGTFWPGVVEVPDEDKLINEDVPNQNSGISEEAKRIITGAVDETRDLLNKGDVDLLFDGK